VSQPPEPPDPPDHQPGRCTGSACLDPYHASEQGHPLYEDPDGGELEEVPDHRDDLGSHCPWSGTRTSDGTCPVHCHEADVLTGFDAGDRELPDSTDLPEHLWPPYCADRLRALRAAP
jgi:hypothetical protein